MNDKTTESRIIVWFSCGAASAVAAKIAVEKYGDRVQVVYCDTLAGESDDNPRFMADVERWIGKKITVIKSDRYATIDEVFMKTRYMAGNEGARCTVEMKKVPRFKFQRADDIHVFGFTKDETKRIKGLAGDNPEMSLLWVLRDAGVTKKECYRRLLLAGIRLPKLYEQGYRNNNCIGCVKATSPGYWNKVKIDYPEVFERRARQSRQLGVRLTRVKNKRIFLDQLPPDAKGRFKMEDISCGPECKGGA